MDAMSSIPQDHPDLRQRHSIQDRDLVSRFVLRRLMLRYGFPAELFLHQVYQMEEPAETIPKCRMSITTLPEGIALHAKGFRTAVIIGTPIAGTSTLPAGSILHP